MIKHDIGIIRSASNINFNEWTHPAPIAGTTYVVPDNDHIWAVGWGARYYGEVPDPQELRHVKVMKYNMDECKKLYKAANFVLPADYMVCAGWPTHDRSQCYGDSGSPIFHHGTVVGVASAAVECGQTGLPAINIPIPTRSSRIVGGDVTTIDQYPSMVAGLRVYDWSIYGQCEGSVSMYRIRLGSSWALSGGIVHRINGIINHPLYYPATADHDICILRSASNINYNELSRPAPIAGTTYVVPDNDYLWAAGWGAQFYGDPSEPEQLRHVKVMKIGLETCQKQYAVDNMVITDKMLCSGWPTGGRDQCQGDSGSPIFHHGVVVGVCSFGIECGLADFPGVNMRVASYTNWILDNA
ncbi:hypothetical protein HF086_009181 [Spodoptera exigua]|uniref:Peptidase S1 domain-containing protein n=1 Tax=Spodoptera exigua TaxID=7107 RepID=A0A922MXP1_SPOEX|nr:hypothetical protein HF086_009181 [Spodoptera exigua]